MDMKIVIENKEQVNYENSIFLTGWHGIGWTGYITIRHIIKTAKSKRIGFIFDESIPDILSIEDERLVLPFEIHRINNFIIFQPPFQPIFPKQSQLIKNLADWIVKSNFKEVILIGGLDIRFQEDEHELRIVPTRSAIEKAKNFETPFLEKGLLIKGPLALLLAHLEMQNFPALTILPYAKPDRPDPAAAAVAVKFLNDHYNLNIEIIQLQTDAQRIEDEIEEILQQERERTQ
ncbi:MAG: proteasome assembly chaperone family protein, partial [Candidatus Helarchaeota archaeon]